jgi:mannose-1-phosphate guanylyltransferase/mannose-6-phosphate isomerase
LTNSRSLPLFAVILAGGSGTRLWPLVRAGRPKPFQALLGGKSLFRRTYERIAPLVGRGNVVVVAGSGHVPLVLRQAPEIPRDRIIAESTGRDTAVSIALAALWIRQRYDDGIMVVLPADHWIEPTGAFRATLALGIEAVRRSGGLLTVGVPARTADTGFGYILPAGRRVAPGVRTVQRFVEKPEKSVAKRMVRSGRFLWNSGIFLWRARSILEELRRLCPAIAGPAEHWARGRLRGPWNVPANLLRRLPAAPIDRAVLEHSRNVLVARATFRWLDLGNWSAIGRLLRGDRRGNSGLGRVLAIDSTGCLGVNPGGLTVFLGAEDVVAVRAEEVLLVCHRDAAHRVKDVVERLRGDLHWYT